MPPKLSTYNLPTAIRSTLLKNPSDNVPPTDELENAYEELKLSRQKALERAKKAGEDLKTIEESMRRQKEMEKGKAKAVEKIKRERDFTPTFSDVDDTRNSGSAGSVNGHTSKPGLSSARSSFEARRSAPEDLKKKKKRKRDVEDSDAEPESQKSRKMTPPPPSAAHSHPHPHPPKSTKSISSSHIQQSKAQPGPDFAVPNPHSLLPPRPPISLPPVAGPSKPTEVTEDFSKAKQPAQVQVSTFYASIEPWIRPIKEEDVGFLEYTADEVEPYIMPKVGRHYLEVWEEEDSDLYGGLMPGSSGGASSSQLSLSAPPVPKWEPSTLMEPDLVVEEKGHGPLTERLISALLPMPDLTVWKGVKAAEDAMEGRPGGSGAAAARREKMNVSDLEERIRDTMRFHGLLNGLPDYSDKVDDPIATALRHAQKELRTVVSTNKLRKERLVDVARDRLGYQEYVDVRDSLDKNIHNLYTKLQRKDAPKPSKKKKKPPETNGTNGIQADVVNVAPLPNPASLGLGPDDKDVLVVSDQLRQLVETRRKWVDTVGAVFEEKQREFPGRIWGLPKESLFEGIDDEVRRGLEQPDSLLAYDKGLPTRPLNGIVGKGKLVDEMDVG